MKKIKLLLVIMLGILLVPFSVFAEEADTTTTENDKKVNIYFFYGDGCSYCAAAEEFFDSIQEEYGEYFNIVDYETWYDSDNAALMERVAEARGEEAEGVPYIIIGDQSWNGYSSDYDEEIKSKIKEIYDQDVSDRYDIMKYIDSDASNDSKDYSSDIVAVILIILVTGGIVGGIWYARKKTA